jgi:nicotinamidase-related amidase
MMLKTTGSAFGEYINKRFGMSNSCIIHRSKPSSLAAEQTHKAFHLNKPSSFSPKQTLKSLISNEPIKPSKTNQMTSQSPFYVPVDLSKTALLLSDVQTQILARFPEEVQKTYLTQIQKLLTFFRGEIEKRRSNPAPKSTLHDEVPLIIHHTLPFNINSNAFVSPYNKLAKWVHNLEAQGFFANAPSDPHTPNYAVPTSLTPPSGWGTKDEILLQKLQPNCFGSSDLLAYLRARGIKHVVLVGLTTMGSVLGSARAGADLDFHIICPREGIIDDDADVNDFLMERVLPKFVDVVGIDDVLGLGAEA